MEFTLSALQFLTNLLIFLLGLGILAVIVMYIVDVTQTTHAIRRNFPVVGRFRYIFEEMGEFFRQYFFALDREGNAVQPCATILGLPCSERRRFDSGIRIHIESDTCRHPDFR